MQLANSKFSEIFKKELHKAIMVIGALYSGFSLFALLIVFLQKTTMSGVSEVGDERFMNLMTQLHMLWITYMPLLFMLGLSYVLFGLFYYKIRFNRFLLNQIISVLFIAWALSYTYSSVDYLNAFTEVLPFQSDILSFAINALWGFGFIVVILFMSFPQYKIGKLIKAKDDLESGDF
jgi:hypothetical protein